MLSDANLPPEVINDGTIRPYTGKFDCVSQLKDKTYPVFPRTERRDAAAV
jgi:nitrogenase molybdenum-iron protein alpha chain